MRNIIEITNLYKSFGNVRAVQGISFDVPGQTVEIEHVGFGELLENLLL